MPNVTGGQEHWQQVYLRKAADDLSWFESVPSTSLRLILDATPARGAVVDVGAGASHLVDHLLLAGFEHVTLVDMSASALAQVAGRLGHEESRVSLVCEDLLDWQPERPVDSWHDRAVFHFLTEAQVERYVAMAASTVVPGGALVLGTFAADGPTSCSGLPTTGYAPERLAELFAREFELRADAREYHRTPWGKSQPFTWVTLVRSTG